MEIQSRILHDVAGRTTFQFTNQMTRHLHKKSGEKKFFNYCDREKTFLRENLLHERSALLSIFVHIKIVSLTLCLNASRSLSLTHYLEVLISAYNAMQSILRRHMRPELNLLLRSLSALWNATWKSPTTCAFCRPSQWELMHLLVSSRHWSIRISQRISLISNKLKRS